MFNPNALHEGEKEVNILKYAMCPHCGRKLCKGEPGTKVELECPKCGKMASIIISVDELFISNKPLKEKPTTVEARI